MDLDGDVTEQVLWIDPADLLANPMVRDELAASLGDVLPLLGVAGDPAQGDEASCPCGAPVVFDEMNGWQHADGSVSHDDGESVSDKMAAVAKAAMPAPKARAQAGKPAAPAWPGWKLDLPTAAYWSPRVTSAAQRALSRERLDAIATAYTADHPGQDGKASGKRERNEAALAWLLLWLLGRGGKPDMSGVAAGITADALLIGGASAAASAAGEDDAGTGAWEPGGTAAAQEITDGLGLAGLAAGGGDGGPELPDVAGDMADGYLGVTSRVLAGWDEGTAADELGGMLADAVADGAYAELLTVTQVTIVAGQAALAYYLANTTSLFSWVAVEDSRTCPACLQNAAAEPRRAGVAWPGGAVAPPQHPGGCRCALVPTWLNSDGSPITSDGDVG